MVTIVLGSIRKKLLNTARRCGVFCDFRLRRPVGMPGNDALQYRVLEHGYSLLNRIEKPLEDFPGVVADENSEILVCVLLPQQARRGRKPRSPAFPLGWRKIRGYYETAAVATVDQTHAAWASRRRYRDSTKAGEVIGSAHLTMKEWGVRRHLRWLLLPMDSLPAWNPR